MSKLGQKQFPSSKTAAAPAPSTMMSPQQAIQMLAARLQALEVKVAGHLNEIEKKLGDHATEVRDNLPDLDVLNGAIREINSRLLDLEELEPRIAALEPASDGSPATETAAPPPKANKKKNATIKLNEN